MGINGHVGETETKLTSNYLAAHRRLTGEKPTDENAGAYRKLTGSSNESLQLQINRLTSQLQELTSRVSYLSSLVPQKSVLPRTPIDRIIDLVCEHEKISRVEILSKRQCNSISRPRQIAYYLATKCTSRSLPQIGSIFGRDHTTILYGRDRITSLRGKDADFDHHIAWYEEQIKAFLSVNYGDEKPKQAVVSRP